MDVMVNRINQVGFWDALPGPWDGDDEEELLCCSVTDETHDVKTFTFRSPLGHLFYFYPGQHITLELEINGERINRCYTVASAPTRPHTLSITVKRQPGGIVSNWLHDTLCPGMRVRVLPPSGNFTCATYPSKKYLFFSAGSGITPLMSMTRAHYDLADDRDIVFLHSARTPNDIIFEQELADLARIQKNFRAFFVCEKRGERREWSGVTGFLSLALLNLCVPDFLEREAFMCGPQPYMKAVSGMLMDAGFPMEKLHQETFDFESLAEIEEGTEALEEAGPISIEDAPDIHVFDITFQKSGHQIQCVSTQSVLDAAIQAGVRLPYSCRQGMCSTCKSKVISGQVEMEHNGGIRQREIDQGYALLCCSRPLSDLVIDR